MHGLSGAIVLGRIVLPLMLPPLLLQPTGVDTVSTFIFSEAQQGNGGAAMAMSVISVAVSFAAVGALRLMHGRPAARDTDLLRADAMGP